MCIADKGKRVESSKEYFNFSLTHVKKKRNTEWHALAYECMNCVHVDEAQHAHHNKELKSNHPFASPTSQFIIFFLFYYICLLAYYHVYCVFNTGCTSGGGKDRGGGE